MTLTFEMTVAPGVTIIRLPSMEVTACRKERGGGSVSAVPKSPKKRLKFADSVNADRCRHFGSGGGAATNAVSALHLVPSLPSTMPMRKSKLSSEYSDKPNITVPKRRYSIFRNDSLQLMEMPVLSAKDEAKTRQKMGPSSPGTVLAMAGLFVCGLMLIVSATIVLCHERSDEFHFVAVLFCGGGAAMMTACGILQRKNIAKYLLDVSNDLYFLFEHEDPRAGGHGIAYI